jgi:hypothetical protein
MRIAVLEDDEQIVERIKQKIDSVFDLSLYQKQDEFLDVVHNFDVVLIDKKFANKDLIDKISGYNIEIGLLNRGKVDFDDEHIAIVLDEEDIDQIAEKLKYFEAKIRIKNLVDIEQRNLKDIKRITSRSEFLKQKSKETQEFLKKIVKNTYYLEFKEDIAILEIRDVFRVEEKNEILVELKKSNYLVAVYFSINNIASVHLGVIANFWKELKSKKGKMVYWNKQKDAKIVSILKLCKLDNILPIIDRFEEVKLKLKEMK